MQTSHFDRCFYGRNGGSYRLERGRFHNVKALLYVPA